MARWSAPCLYAIFEVVGNVLFLRVCFYKENVSYVLVVHDQLLGAETKEIESGTVVNSFPFVSLQRGTLVRQ